MLILIPILVVPFGRIKDIREDLLAATKIEAEGGSGIGLKFWEWNEEQIKEHIKV
jgi:retinol dehydrogenase 12